MESLLYKLIERDYGMSGNGRWFHSKDHDSLVYDAEKDIFFWNSEGIQGDAYVYLTKVRMYPHETAKEFLKENKNFIGTFIHEINNGLETVVYPKLVDIFHENIWSDSREYFHSRTITDETISRYRLGKHNEFYTIPFYYEGIFKQFQLRKDNPKTIRNYYKGVGPLLFNSDIMKLTSKITLVEGPTSCLVLNQNGIPSVSMNTGSEGFQPEWIKDFQNQKEIVILFDNDNAGKFGAIRAAKILGEGRCYLYNFQDTEVEHYDPNDWFKETKGTGKEFMADIESKLKYACEYKEYKLEKTNKKYNFRGHD